MTKKADPKKSKAKKKPPAKKKAVEVKTVTTKKTEPTNKAKLDQFIELYFIHNQNATKAATEAGYSEHTAKQQGCRLLTNVYVREKVDQINMERYKRLRMSREEIEFRLGAIARSDPRRVGKWGQKAILDGDGQPVVDHEGNPRTYFDFTMYDSETLDDDVAITIKQIKIKQGKDGTEISFKQHDPVAALGLLARINKMVDSKDGDDDGDEVLAPVGRIRIKTVDARKPSQ